MPDIAAIAGVTSALNAALDISKTMLGVRDQALFQAKSIELNREIITAQQNAMAANAAQANLFERIRALEKEGSDMEKWETEKKRYELKRVALGSYAYSLKANTGDTEIPHWLCTTCYENRKKSILQAQALQIHAINGQGTIWVCPVCSGRIRVPFDITGRTPNEPV